MTCLFRPRCNHLWSVWYCIFVVGLHAYLVYLGINRYQLYEEIPWRHGAKPQIYLYIYIGLQALVVVCLPFFIGCSMFKTGNIASDSEALGVRTERVLEIRGRACGCCSKKCKSCWQHGPPAAQTIHLIMAFALLIGEQLMIAHFYKDYRNRAEYDEFGPKSSTTLEYEKLDDDLLWGTDLDFIYRSGSRLGHVLPLSNNVYASWTKTDFERYLQSHQVDPRVLPIVASQKLFGINIEFLNYFVALTIFAVTYPSVLWRASKWFSFLFSIHLMLHAFAAIFAFIGFTLLYRLQIIQVEQQTEIGTLKANFILPNSYCVLGCYLISIVTMYLASAILYGYGYTRYCLCWLLQSQKRNRQVSGMVKPEKSILRYPTESGYGCCEGYCPHMLAIFLLIMMVAAKIFLLYDITIIFLNHSEQKPMALSCMVAEVAYLFAWIFLWLFLTCKRRWEFKVSYRIEDLICLLHADRAPPNAISDQKNGVPAIADPDNAMLLMTNEELYITDDSTKKAAILRQAHKYGLGSPKDEVYWLKPNGPASPAVGANQPRQVLTSADKNSPEMNKLLSGQPEQENEYSVAASTPLTDRQPEPYYKVSFDDGQQMNVAGKPPIGVRQPRQIHQSNTGTRPGSYLRFGEIEGTNEYDDHAHDVVTTFGTMPRGEYKRRRLLQGSDADFQYPHYGGQPMVGSRHGSETGSVTYASVHKSHPSPAPSNGYQSSRDYVRLAQQPVVGVGDNESNVSRGSSYVNIPSSYSKQFPMRQGSWDSAGSTRMPPGPPQARVTLASANYQLQQKHPSPSPENFIQQTTPLSSRAQSRFQQPQQHYASVNGGNDHSSTYQTYGTSQNTNLTRVRQSPPAERATNTRGMVQPSDPYSQRTGVKMSSFTDISKVNQPDPLVALLGGTTTTSGQTGNPSREATPMSNGSSTLNRYGSSVQPQPQQVHWHTNPMYGQEPLADNATYTTPSSTLTSQGSYTLTPTPSSPPSSIVSSTNQSNVGAPNGNGNNSGISTRKASGGGYGNSSQPAPVRPAPMPNNYGTSTSKGHNRNDSANYSLTSSNESGEPVPNGQFTTSIV